MRHFRLASLTTLALILGACAAGRVTAPAPAATPGYPHLADGRRPEGMCMWDGADLRLCLHYAFGGCVVFGDFCPKATYEGIEPAPPAPAP